MGSVDARGRLDERPLAYRASRKGQVFITWQGRTVTLDDDGGQLALAQATGNFRRGNERRGR